MQTGLGIKLVAVMDVNILKLFTAEGLKITGNIGNFELTLENDHVHEKKDGFHASKSGQSGFFDPHSTAKEIDISESSRNAYNHIEKKFNTLKDCKEVIIVCDPKMLGALRHHFSGNLKKLVTKELNKDLTHHTTESIEKAIFA